MNIVLAEHQLALGLEPGDDVLVAVFYESSLVVRNIGSELALCINRADHRNAGSLQGVVVVLAEAAGCMYDTSTILGGYICCREYPECTLLCDGCEVVEQRLVGHAHQLASLLGPYNLVVGLFLIVSRKPCLSHDVALSSVFDLHIVNLRVHSQGLVGWQCPWSCGPCQEVCVVLSFYLELDGDGRVCVLLVAAQVQLVVGKYSGAPRAVRQDVEALVDKPLVPKLLNNPPDGLHIVRVHGLVVVVEIDPAAHTGHGLAPFAGIAEHDLAAVLVELCDAVVLNLLLSGDLQFLLHLVLYRKSVAVPSEAAVHQLSLHGHIAWINIFDCTRNKVSEVRKSCGKRRTVVEYIFAASFPLLHRLLENIILFPELEDSFLHLRKINFRIYRVVQNILQNINKE